MVEGYFFIRRGRVILYWDVYLREMGKFLDKVKYISVNNIFFLVKGLEVFNKYIW